MNHRLSSRVSVVLALVALLMNTIAAFAYPAEPPDIAFNAGFIKTPCYQVIETAKEVASDIDIPSHRAEYAALDQIADCLRVGGVNTSIPVTGRAAWTTSQYLEMKDHQAELMDSAGSPEPAHVDPKWMKFKDLQAERMGH